MICHIFLYHPGKIWYPCSSNWPSHSVAPALPPQRPEASKIVTSQPRSRSFQAATNPASPPPTTTTLGRAIILLPPIWYGGAPRKMEPLTARAAFPLRRTSAESRPGTPRTRPWPRDLPSIEPTFVGKQRGRPALARHHFDGPVADAETLSQTTRYVNSVARRLQLFRESGERAEED